MFHLFTFTYLSMLYDQKLNWNVHIDNNDKENFCQNCNSTCLCRQPLLILSLILTMYTAHPRYMHTCTCRSDFTGNNSMVSMENCASKDTETTISL